MFEAITPRFRFVCDRCGAEQYGKESLSEIKTYVVSFGERTPERIFDSLRKGDVCEKCFEDFKELADNFFAEENTQIEETSKLLKMR